MPDYYKTHSITVENRLGFDTKFELEQWLSSAPGTVNKLPITLDKKPQIISKSSSDGRGVMNNRITLALCNEYNDDFRTIFNNYSEKRPRLKIKIQFADSVDTQVFLGILDYEYLGNPKYDFDPIIYVDFATGLSLITDKIFNSTAITEEITGSALIDRRILIDHILSQIFFQDICTFSDEIIYAFGNNLDETLIWFEQWRVAQEGVSEPGITYPTCVLIDIWIDIQDIFENVKTYREVIADLCRMFDLTIGYSQTYEAAMVHFFTEGKSGDDYRLITTSGTITHNEERDIASSVHSIQTISSADVMNKPKPLPITYPPLNSINIKRPGPTEFDGINGSNIPIVKETLEENSTENHYTEKQFVYEYLAHTYPSGTSPFAGIYIKDEKEAVDLTSKIEPARIMRNDGVDFYYEDITEFMANVFKDHRFSLREGLKLDLLKWIDPMLPFEDSDTGKIHRIVKSSQDPIKISSSITSIEIGETV